MPSPRVLKRLVEGCRGIISLSPAVTLTVALSACSTSPQSGPIAAAPVAASSRQSEQCSMFGVLACTAMSMISGDAIANRQATCSAYRTAQGTRVESCGSVEIQGRTTGSGGIKADSDSVRLSWSDNSNNEINFVIERCDQIRMKAEGHDKTASCAGSWTRIGIVGANITSYVDNRALTNQTYIYRVKAINNVGSSDYSNEAWITAPPRIGIP
jgi:hypothetical protein